MTEALGPLFLMASIGVACFLLGRRSARADLEAAERVYISVQTVNTLNNAIAKTWNENNSALDGLRGEAASLRAVIDSMDKNGGRRLDNVEAAVGELVIAVGRGFGVNTGARNAPGRQVGEKAPE
jgi:hypothetical protein